MPQWQHTTLNYWNISSFNDNFTQKMDMWKSALLPDIIYYPSSIINIKKYRKFPFKVCVLFVRKKKKKTNDNWKDTV